MHIVVFLLFALVVGTTARILVPGSSHIGWMVSVGLGVVGAMVGGFLGAATGICGAASLPSFMMSLIGAVLVLGVYHVLTEHPGQSQELPLR